MDQRWLELMEMSLFDRCGLKQKDDGVTGNEAAAAGLPPLSV